ncbi:MAG: hypothetical protein WB948_03010 [Desulfobaccales bacterium]
MNQAQKQLKCRPRGKPWPPGVSGNLAGRPKGALNKLSLAVRGGPLAVNRQAGVEQAPAPEPFKFDPRRGHEHTMHKIDGRWRRTVEQDGRIFDRETGVLLP